MSLPQKKSLFLYMGYKMICGEGTLHPNETQNIIHFGWEIIEFYESKRRVHYFVTTHHEVSNIERKSIQASYLYVLFANLSPDVPKAVSQYICHSLWTGNIWEWCKWVLINSETTASALRGWVLSKWQYLWGEIAYLAISLLCGGFFIRGLFLVSPGPLFTSPGNGEWIQIGGLGTGTRSFSSSLLILLELSEHRELPAESSHQSWKCSSVRAQRHGLWFSGTTCACLDGWVHQTLSWKTALSPSSHLPITSRSVKKKKKAFFNAITSEHGRRSWWLLTKLAETPAFSKNGETSPYFYVYSTWWHWKHWPVSYLFEPFQQT